MNPLLQQISIGAGALVVGFLIGLLTNRARLRRARARGQQTAERLQAELAVQRVQITDLRSRVASFNEANGPRVAELEARSDVAEIASRDPGVAMGSRGTGAGGEDVYPIVGQPRSRPNRVATSQDRSADSATSRT